MGVGNDVTDVGSGVDIAMGGMGNDSTSSGAIGVG